MMKGVGGPLLCIGDLLSDVGESDASPPLQQHEPSASSAAFSSPTQNPDLTKLFQENYEQLNEALAGTDHSWAGLTLKLCGALETANKLVQTTNSNVTMLSEKVGDLERVIKRADSAIATARVVHASLNEKEGSHIGNQIIH
ncbi:uncharacterized protein LOC126782787 [Argentina anserina]|uniref:uncharacterized protein LOC126782787 n=1 Tax=Argentina anserina TaxID=57926 RepID=UPI00217654FE|nr:uncharacterized protein LOC126782787 [Potentilla anserina]XP_050364059.1 uncharacterized protein LOC126782787 [Potentilla anserina]